MFTKNDYDLTRLNTIGGVPMALVEAEEKRKKNIKPLNKEYKKFLPKGFKTPKGIRRTTTSIQRNKMRFELIEAAENENKERDYDRVPPSFPISSEFQYIMNVRLEDEKLSRETGKNNKERNNLIRSCVSSQDNKSILCDLKNTPINDKSLSKLKNSASSNTTSLSELKNINTEINPYSISKSRSPYDNCSLPFITSINEECKDEIQGYRKAVSERRILTYEYTNLLKGHDSQILCIVANVDYIFTGSSVFNKYS